MKEEKNGVAKMMKQNKLKRQYNHLLLALIQKILGYDEKQS